MASIITTDGVFRAIHSNGNYIVTSLATEPSLLYPIGTKERIIDKMAEEGFKGRVLFDGVIEVSPKIAYNGSFNW